MPTQAKPLLSPIAERARLIQLGFDDLASVRHVHASSFRTIVEAGLADAEVQAFRTYANSDRYLDALAEQVRTRRLLGLTVDNTLAGTVGWSPAASADRGARLDHVFVLALFGRIGLGSRLVVEFEQEALLAGHTRFQTRTLADQSPFFTRLGYKLTSHDALKLPGDVAIRCANMRKLTTHVTEDRRRKRRSH